MKNRQGTNFICCLVSPENQNWYCQAQFKKTAGNATKYEQALKMFTKGARFVMSKVVFADDAKAAYVSCPLKMVVDLSKSKLDSCVDGSDSAVQPAPTTTVAGSDGLRSNQFFDITVLVIDVGDVREHDNNRSSFVVQVHDGSLDKDTQKVKTMPLRVYFDIVPANTHTNSDGHPVSTQNAKKLRFSNTRLSSDAQPAESTNSFSRLPVSSSAARPGLVDVSP